MMNLDELQAGDVVSNGMAAYVLQMDGGELCYWSGAREWQPVRLLSDWGYQRYVPAAELTALLAKVARCEALVKEWRHPGYSHGHIYARELAAALADPPLEKSLREKIEDVLDEHAIHLRGTAAHTIAVGKLAALLESEAGNG